MFQFLKTLPTGYVTAPCDGQRFDGVSTADYITYRIERSAWVNANSKLAQARAKFGRACDEAALAGVINSTPSISSPSLPTKQQVQQEITNLMDKIQSDKPPYKIVNDNICFGRTCVQYHACGPTCCDPNCKNWTPEERAILRDEKED